MSSIRPVITISILLVVAWFLFQKINQGPTQVGVGELNPPADATSLGVPSLSVNGPSGTNDGSVSLTPGNTTSLSANDETAPRWPVTATNSAAANEKSMELPPASDPSTGSNIGYNGESGAASTSTESVETASVPPVPQIPDLPPLLSEDDEPKSPTASVPINLPANVPTARYASEAPVANPPTPTNVTPLAAAPTATTQNAGQPNARTFGSTGSDRYGSVSAAETTAPSESPFEASWAEIQAALARQDLSGAHQKLSQWYENPALSRTEAQQVDALLSQLAGTVVYSTEHRLEPPYTVRTGETLQTIAAQFEVPWQLLAKINGVPASNMVQPGQELKVVRGPFSAVIDLAKNEMTLMLNDRYAGRFAITPEAAAAGKEGQWVVEQKLVSPAASPQGVVGAAYASGGPVDRVLVLRNDTTAGGPSAISITSGSTQPSGPTAVAPAAARLSLQDAEEVADILSIGSRVTIRR